MKFLKIKLIITLLLYVVNISNKAYSLPIIADIDQRSINITSSFVGQELLIFGTTQYFGDIVIKVEGPKESFIVRKKKKIFGMWFNKDFKTYSNVKSFYKIFSSNDIDSSNLIYNNFIDNSSSFKDGDNFDDALHSYFENQDLYYKKKNNIIFIGDNLFRANINFPEKIVRGNYTVTIYLISDNVIKASQILNLSIQKVGFDAFIYSLAMDHSFGYGVLCILLACFLGIMAKILFYKKT